MEGKTDGERSLEGHLISSFPIQEHTNIDVHIDGILKKMNFGRVLINSSRLDKVIHISRIFSELIMGDTEVDYPENVRSEIEFKAGYKIAIARGALLNTVRVYNLFFRLKNSVINGIDGLPLAQIYPFRRKNERWILLYPVDTASLIMHETDVLELLVGEQVSKGLLPKEASDLLYDNNSIMNVNERCAQTLMHEYGHIRHWEYFDLLSQKYGVNYKESPDLFVFATLQWFVASDYVGNISQRCPYFKATPDIKEKMYYLKECFVEDYRIGLNIQDRNGKFILAGKYTAFADLKDPSLLMEGVGIVEKMIAQADAERMLHRNKDVFNTEREAETNRVEAWYGMHKLILDTNWTPEDGIMSDRECEELLDKAFKSVLKEQGRKVSTTELKGLKEIAVASELNENKGTKTLN